MLTDEQQAVIDHLLSIEADEDEIVLINAVAGAGKTLLLTKIAEALKPKSGIYLAYNKSIADEAQVKFRGSYINCSTMHSLAYRAVVKAQRLKVGNFGWRDIKVSTNYDYRVLIVETIREYCLSKYCNFEDFTKANKVDKNLHDDCAHYLEQMYLGKISCTHDFYLKLFHIMLDSGDVEYPKQDVLLIDEAGDLTAVTLEIFNLIPARIKLAVGDNCQNIYGFNYTINAFEHFGNEVSRFGLTKSFRVEESIAERIEDFCKRHINPNMQFKGVPITDTKIDNTAIISRTNAGLIQAAIELAASNTPFHTVRSVAAIFSLPLSLCYATYQGKFGDREYAYLQDDINEWYEMPKDRGKKVSLFFYLGELYPNDIALQTAISTVSKYGRQKIIAAYDYAKKCQDTKKQICLATAHSIKGMEYSEVIIQDDLNNKILKILSGESSDDEETIRQELNLYYVACSRAKKFLHNATALMEV